VWCGEEGVQSAVEERGQESVAARSSACVRDVEWSGAEGSGARERRLWKDKREKGGNNR